MNYVHKLLVFYCITSGFPNFPTFCQNGKYRAVYGYSIMWLNSPSKWTGASLNFQIIKIRVTLCLKNNQATLCFTFNGLTTLNLTEYPHRYDLAFLTYVSWERCLVNDSSDTLLIQSEIISSTSKAHHAEALIGVLEYI